MRQGSTARKSARGSHAHRLWGVFPSIDDRKTHLTKPESTRLPPFVGRLPGVRFTKVVSHRAKGHKRMKLTQTLAGLFSLVALIMGSAVVTVGSAGAAEQPITSGCMIASVDVATELTQSDCDTLITFFAATNGSEWKIASGWDTPTDPCSWHGITCDVNEAGTVGVTELNLSWNQLSGPMPAEIGDLADLHTLILQGNTLSGPIPAEIADLTQLEFLALSGNPLGGQLPVELWTLAKLQLLVIENAGLAGGLSPAIGDLTNLSVLVLTGNELSGPIPSQLADLANISYIDLSNNELVGVVPARIAEQERLGRILLDGNDGLTSADNRDFGDEVTIEVSCLGPNGRLDIALDNTTDATADYAVTVGALAPRNRVVGAGSDDAVTVTGRADGPLDVMVTRDGFEIHVEQVTIACDPAVEVFVYATCVAGHGRVDATINNMTGADADYAVTFGSLAPRDLSVAAGLVDNLATTGRAEGPLDVSVTRNGQTIYTATEIIACS